MQRRFPAMCRIGLRRTPLHSKSLNLYQTPHRHMDAISTWLLPSQMMHWYWQYYTFFPLLVMDWMRPSNTMSKVPFLHYMQEKRAEMKLQECLDSIATEWNDEVDDSLYDVAISRNIFP